MLISFSVSTSVNKNRGFKSTKAGWQQLYCQRNACSSESEVAAHHSSNPGKMKISYQWSRIRHSSVKSTKSFLSLNNLWKTGRFGKLADRCTDLLISWQFPSSLMITQFAKNVHWQNVSKCGKIGLSVGLGSWLVIRDIMWLKRSAKVRSSFC